MMLSQSNNQWSGGIATHDAPNNSEFKNPLENFLSRFSGVDQDGIFLVNYFPKSQTIKAEDFSSLLVQLNDILKEKRRGRFTKCVLFLHNNVSSHRALTTQNKMVYLRSHYLDHPRIWPRRTTTCSLA
jgi:hypothetical protein